jgi:hypothetical protein
LQSPLAFKDDNWVEVDSSDVGFNGREITESAFTDLFGRLTALPAIAFQAPGTLKRRPIRAAQHPHSMTPSD